MIHHIYILILENIRFLCDWPVPMQSTAPTTNSNHHFKWNMDWSFQDRRISCEQGCGQFFVLPAEEEMVPEVPAFVPITPPKTRWNLKNHRFCRFFRGENSSSTVSFRKYIPCHNPMRCDVIFRHQVGRISRQAAKACLAHSALVVRAPVVRALAWLCRLRLCRLCLCLVVKACLACLTTRGMAAVGWISKACKACSPWIRWECNKGPAWLNSHLLCTLCVTIMCVNGLEDQNRHLKIEECEQKSVFDKKTLQVIVGFRSLLPSSHLFLNQCDHLGSMRFFKKISDRVDKKNYSKAVCVCVCLFFCLTCFLVTPNFCVFFKNVSISSFSKTFDAGWSKSINSNILLVKFEKVFRAGSHDGSKMFINET